MARKEPTGDVWSVNTLHRATRIGQRTFARAAERKVQWPQQNWQKLEQDDPVAYTSLEDAFDTVLQFMSQTTKQCKRYYRSHPPVDRAEEAARCHCDRFHTPKYMAVQRKRPCHKVEDVNVIVPPGSYAISATPWNNTERKTRIVHVQDGQTVDLDFVV